MSILKIAALTATAGLLFTGAASAQNIAQGSKAKLDQRDTRIDQRQARVNNEDTAADQRLDNREAKGSNPALIAQAQRRDNRLDAKQKKLDREDRRLDRKTGQ